MRAVIKSLFVTVCLVVCGWMTTDLIGVLTVTIPMDPYVANMIQLFCGTFIFTSSAFNAFVYYKMSRDYRVAMRALFGVSNATHAQPYSTYREATDAQRSSVLTSPNNATKTN
uniref:G-protein coupled receptors family 1 profile domain-containing protein n=1 Tax=Caenorhabditis japonica TaxID=281687 RepID=A0A8R1ESS3_CAEJA